MKVFPSKHILLSETCYGLGGLILKIHESGDDIDILFKKFKQELNRINEDSNSVVNNYYLTLTYLYALDIIKINQDLTIEI